MAEVVFFDDCFELVENRRESARNGETIRDFLDFQGIPDFQNPTLCLINERPTLRKDWEVIELTESDVVVFLRLPAGGGGGGGKILKTVLTIAVTVAAIATGGAASAAAFAGLGAIGSSAVGALASGAVLFAGQALINAFLPPPKPKLQTSSSADRETSPTYSITASGNQIRLGDSIPEVYGRHKVFMDLAAQPYVNYLDNDQYLYQYHCVGRGEYDIEDIYIGDTNINNFEEVETEVIEPGQAISLFRPHVVTSVEVSGIQLDETNTRGPFTINQPKSKIEFVEFDVVLPRGLYYSNDDGDLDEQTLSLSLSVRQVGDTGVPIGNWQVLGTPSITEATTSAVRMSYKYPVLAGRYEARFNRVSTKEESFRYGNDLVISSVKGYLQGENSYDDMTMIAVRMRATDNLNQNSSKKINCIAKRKLPIWDGTTWSAPTFTNNPAWIIADIVQRVNEGSYDAFDLATLKAEADLIDSSAETFDGIFDSAISAREALNQVARVSRGVVIETGGKFKLIRDTKKTIPSMMFTPQNILKGSLSIDYNMPTDDSASSVELSYYDNQIWQFKEVTYNSANATAGQTAKIKMIGVTSEYQANRMAEYLAKANVYRRKTISFETGLEGLIPGYGDLIAVTDDIIADSISGEVKNFNAGTFTLSEPMPSSDSTGWKVAFRNTDGSPTELFDFTVGSELNEITLNTGSFTPYIEGSQERTFYTLNKNEDWTLTAKVIAIQPKGDESVQIVCTPDDSRVYDTDLNTGLDSDVAEMMMVGNYRLACIMGEEDDGNPGSPTCTPASYSLNNAIVNSPTKYFGGGDILNVGTNDFSVMIWVKSGSDNEEFLSKEGDGDSEYWAFYSDASCRSSLRINTADGRRIFYATNPNVCSNNWKQVIVYVNRSSASATFAIDGNIVNTSESSPIGTITGSCSNSSEFRIGLRDKISGGNTNSNLCFAGIAIGEDLTLDAAELYNGGDPLCFERLDPATQEKFTSIWPLANWNGNTGSELEDSKGTNNLTNNGTVLFNGSGLNVGCCVE